MDEIDYVIKSKREHLVIHVKTNELTKGMNEKNILQKKLSKWSTKSYLRHVSPIQIWLTLKTGKTFAKKLRRKLEDWRIIVGKRISLIKNASINEELLGVKKLHLNRKGNSCFAKNLLKYFNIVWLGLNIVRHESFLKINYCRDSR